jgi:NADH-quinone oxidoreductase subunit F
LLLKIERGDARPGDLDLLTEVAGSMGSMPGTTICGLADGTAWATRTIVEKFRSEFEARIRSTGAAATVGASS